MLVKNKWWKSLLGVFAEAIIAKAVDYAGTGTSTVGAGTGGTTANSFADFVVNSVEGEVGVFYSDTLLLISGATAGSPAATPVATAGREIFVAMKRNGQIEQTNGFVPANCKITRAVYAAGVQQVSTAAFTGTPVAGSEYVLKVLETTPGSQPYPSWFYNITAKPAESLATMLARLVVIINDNTNLINKDTDPIVTASLASTTITLTAKAVGTTFKLAFNLAALTDLAATPTYTTGGYYGSGTFAMVAELEQETDVMKGITTQYAGGDGSIPSDYGVPAVFALSTGQYTTYIINGRRTEDSPTSKNQHSQKQIIILAIPSNGSANADSEVKGILGF